MPSLFPELLDFAVLGVFVLRVVAGLYYFLLGERLIRALREGRTQGGVPKYVGYVYGIAHVGVGSFLLAGLLTQGAALAGMVVSLLFILSAVGKEAHPSERHVHVLLVAVCVALLFLGAGAFAQDLPL